MSVKVGRRAEEVFGMSNEILEDSYVDRGKLDEKIQRALGRKVHIVIRGASKSGKSWLRQQAVPNAIVLQCRLGKTVEDLYVETLGALGIDLIITRKAGQSFSGTLEASASSAKLLIVAVAAKLGLTYSRDSETETKSLRQNVNDLSFIAGLILESKRRLVIEDVHYLSLAERKKLAFDLKTLWDLGVFVVIVGVWKEQSLIDLNPDLSSRVKEFSVVWETTDLVRIIDKGADVLNFHLAEPVRQQLTTDAFGNAGLLQALLLGTLDEAGFEEASLQRFHVDSIGALQDAAMEHAESLNTLYQSFAKRVSSGIRKRKNSTGIYAHAMKIVFEQDDDTLKRGVPLADIFAIAHEREPRILLPNLRTAMQKIEGLQIDEEGRGLVLSYDEGSQQVNVVDHQLLLYRNYATVEWPWEAILEEVSEQAGAFTSDD